MVLLLLLPLLVLLSLVLSGRRLWWSDGGSD